MKRYTMKAAKKLQINQFLKWICLQALVPGFFSSPRLYFWRGQRLICLWDVYNIYNIKCTYTEWFTIIIKITRGASSNGQLSSSPSSELGSKDMSTIFEEGWLWTPSPLQFDLSWRKKKNESANFQIDKIRGTEYRLKTLEPRKALIFKIFELGIV